MAVPLSVRSRITFFVLAAAMAWASSVGAQAQVTSSQSPQAERASRLWLRWLAVTAPERLPTEAQGLVPEAPVKCGTELLLQLHALRDVLSPSQRRILAQYMARPTLPHAIISPSGRFRIHYATEGYDAVSTEDQDDDGVPDFVQHAAQAFDRSYTVIVDSLGFDPPPDDGGVDGPEYDVYMLRLPGLYGETVFENVVSSSPQTYSSFIRVDSQFLPGSYFSPGLDGLRVTAAHEYFHAVQLGYAFRDQDIFYFEACSVWMEDIVYDDVNDYLQYMPYFFRHLSLPFNVTDGQHEYGLALWNKFLTRRWGGADIIRDVWEFMREAPTLQAIPTALEQRGSSFSEMLTEFSLWNYFTGSRARLQQFYEEGDLYPEVTYNREIAVEADTALADSTVSLSSLYIRFKVLVTDQFSVRLVAENPLIWKYVVVVANPGQPAEFSKLNPGSNGALGKVESFADIIVIPTNTLIGDPADDPYAAGDRHRFELRLRRGPVETGLLADRILTPRPHPFLVDGQQQAVFDFVLGQTGPVKVRILDVAGRLIWERDLGRYGDGFNAFRWDGRDTSGRLVDSGIYLLQLHAPSAVLTKKFVVVRR